MGLSPGTYGSGPFGSGAYGGFGSGGSGGGGGGGGVSPGVSGNPSAVSQIFAGLTRTQVLDQNGMLNWQWVQGVNKLAQATGAPAISGAVPASATATGSPGQIACDGGHIYICVATNQWLRAPLATW